MTRKKPPKKWWKSQGWLIVFFTAVIAVCGIVTLLFECRNNSRIDDVKRDQQKSTERQVAYERRLDSVFSTVGLLVDLTRPLDIPKQFDSIENETREYLDAGGYLESNYYLKLGNACYWRANYSCARCYFQKALEQSFTAADTGVEAFALNAIGLVNYMTARYEAAMDTLRLSRDKFSLIGDRLGEIDALSNIGMVEYSLDSTDAALATFREVLRIDTLKGDRSRLGKAMGNIGLIYRSKEEYDSTELYYSSALDASRAIHDSITESEILNNYGAMYLALGEREKAKVKLDSALSLCNTLQYELGLANVYGNLGVYYEDSRLLLDMPKQFEYHMRALELHQRAGYRYGEALDLLNLVRCYCKFGLSNNAERFQSQAQDLLAQGRFPALLDQLDEIVDNCPTLKRGRVNQ